MNLRSGLATSHFVDLYLFRVGETASRKDSWSILQLSTHMLSGADRTIKYRSTTVCAIHVDSTEGSRSIRSCSIKTEVAGFESLFIDTQQFRRSWIAASWTNHLLAELITTPTSHVSWKPHFFSEMISQRTGSIKIPNSHISKKTAHPGFEPVTSVLIEQ